MKFLFDHDVPDDLSYLLQELGHEVSLLRGLLPKDGSDPIVFPFAYDNDFLLVTCNRDDFIKLAKQKSYHRMIIVSAAKHALRSGRRYSICWNALEKMV